jgi:hypothetical protein
MQAIDQTPLHHHSTVGCSSVALNGATVRTALWLNCHAISDASTRAVSAAL